jgi:two-component system response regulator HydG
MNRHAEQPWILIVDDELSHRTMLRAHLQSMGYKTLEVGDGRTAVETARRERPSLIIMDIVMPGLDGISALQEIRTFDAHVPVVIMTGRGTMQSAFQAGRSGAYLYLEKPVDIDDIQQAVENGLQFGALTHGAPIRDVTTATQGMIWKSPLIGEILDTVTRVAPSDASVLITGESGTGKEVIADMIQRLSGRVDKPFVKVNCAALHEQLLESELFGHERGAFTGALDQRRGRFELAHTGTLFLDEIGDMASTTQAKILRVLQSGTFERLGGIETLSVDVRIIAATNHELKQAIAQGAFRKDLFFRLSVVPIHLPPLRERREEIPVFAEHFLEMYSRKNRREIHAYAPGAMQALLHYDWPGNVRELENVVERAAILTIGDTITPDVLPEHIRYTGVSEPHGGEQLTMLELAERDLIVKAMLACDGNRTRAAEHLGMSRRSLYNKLKRYNLDQT